MAVISRAGRKWRWKEQILTVYFGLTDPDAPMVAKIPAIFALIVDAKEGAARSFYEHHGFRRFASRPMTLYLPIAEGARRLAAGRC